VSGRTLAVVTAGLGRPSSTRLLADRLAAATRRDLESRGADVDVQVVELRDVAHDLTNNLLTGFAAPDLRRVLDAVADADGLIAVTPIFNASYSGLFKTFFDVLDMGYDGRRALEGAPVLVAATGGTARHSLALDLAVRPLFGYLRASVVPTAVFAAAEDWGSAGNTTGAAEHSGLGRRIERAGRELAEAMASRPMRPQVDALADPMPFERLLAGG
jgi:FMN reductase